MAHVGILFFISIKETTEFLNCMFHLRKIMYFVVLFQIRENQWCNYMERKKARSSELPMSLLL